MTEVDGRRAGATGPGAPPPYTVRVSARARRARLVVSAERGLEVVIPRGFSRRAIPALLEEKQAWIERATARVQARAEAVRRRLEADPPRLPGRISFPSVGEEWAVEYRSAGPGAPGAPQGRAAPPSGRVKGATARERPGLQLLVTGNLEDVLACKEALCRWMHRRARAALSARLEELAGQHRLTYGRVSVRHQRSRWGSCSRRKTISLNARLLFLPPEIVDHVLLHELCHTVEMNHSPRFWTLLGYHDPGCRIHRKALRNAGTFVPTWLEHGVEEPAV